MSKKSRSISLNEFSFWLIVAAAILYLVGLILSIPMIGLGNITAYLQSVAAALMICVVAILAWRYVANKPVVWKVLYFVVLLIIICGLIIPRIF